jgi:hypothetical protein
MAETKPLPTEEGPRNFAVFLTHAFDGDANSELSVALKKVLEEIRAKAVATQGKASGSLTFKLDLTVNSNSDLSMGYDVKTKSPKPVRQPCTIWVTEAGNAVFDKPRQIKLPFRDVNSETETKDAPAAAANMKEL